VARLRGGIEFVKRGHIDGSEARTWLVDSLVCMQVGWRVRVALALHRVQPFAQVTTLAARYPCRGWLQHLHMCTLHLLSRHSSLRRDEPCRAAHVRLIAFDGSRDCDPFVICNQWQAAWQGQQAPDHPRLQEGPHQQCQSQYGVARRLQPRT
jgi:hypothetical protein